MEITGKYWQYGSKNSTDRDMLFEVDFIDNDIEKVYTYCKELKKEYPCNINLCQITNGIVTQVIKRKSLIDGLNNSLFYTYKNHNQQFTNPIIGPVPRIKELSHYKCLRTVLQSLTRTDLRKIIKPNLNAWHPFDKKIEMLDKIDLSKIDTFNQNYESDVDLWKIIAFYLGQAISLENNIEIYEKDVLIDHHPELLNFINRTTITLDDKIQLQSKWLQFSDILKSWNYDNSKPNILIVNSIHIDMLNENII